MAVCITDTVSWVMTLQNDRQVAEFHNNLITYYTNATSPWRLYLTHGDDYLQIYKPTEILVLWNVTLCHWWGVPKVSKDYSAFSFRVRQSKQNDYACNILVCAHRSQPSGIVYTWSDNKVRKLATVCLLWQHWTKALVWFDDIDISVFHSCVVVDLWESLSEWHL